MLMARIGFWSTDKYLVVTYAVLFAHPLTVCVLTVYYLIIDFCAETAEGLWQGWVGWSGETEREQACVQTGPHHQGEVSVYAVLSVACRGHTSTLWLNNTTMLLKTFLCVQTVLRDKHLFVSKHCCESGKSLSPCPQNRSVVRNDKNTIL